MGAVRLQPTYDRVATLSRTLSQISSTEIHGGDSADVAAAALRGRAAHALPALAAFATGGAGSMRVVLDCFGQMSRLGFSQALCVDMDVRKTIVDALVASEDDDELAGAALPVAITLGENEQMLRSLRANAATVSPLLIRWLLHWDSTHTAASDQQLGERPAGSHVCLPSYWRDAELSREMARCAATLLQNLRAHHAARQASIRVLAEPQAQPRAVGVRSAKARLALWLGGAGSGWGRRRASRRSSSSSVRQAQQPVKNIEI